MAASCFWIAPCTRLPCALLAAVAIVAFTMPNSTALAHRSASWETTRLGQSRAPALVAPGDGHRRLALYVAVASIGSVESKFIYFNF